jgi:DNA-binding GntR family transcriptional regulator
VYERLTTAPLNDQHQAALSAIAAKDAIALREAITADIGDGMGLIGKAMLANVRAV